MDVVIALIIVVLASVTIFKLNFLATKININLNHNSYLNNHSKYQLALLLLACFVMLLVYLQNPQNFNLLFSLGNISAPVEPVQWFGIGERQNWLFAGLYLSVLITSGTLLFVYIQFRKSAIQFSEILPYVFWIILFSLTNSFSEEAIFRLGVIVPLYGNLATSELVLLSAVIFGLVHFAGMPHGLIGMLMAGFLGWFLAKSVVETEGIFWAWLIHFLQDVVIYTGFIVATVSANRKAETIDKLPS